ANAVFLDLPAPWLALKHLVRNPENGKQSPLDPKSPVYICTFSPCLEQAQRTISTLRQMSWLSISMVEVNHRRIETRRERHGLDTEGIPGAAVFPKAVAEAVENMRTIEERARRFRAMQNEGDTDSTPTAKENEDLSTEPTTASSTTQQTQDQTPVHLMG